MDKQLQKIQKRCQLLDSEIEYVRVRLLYDEAAQSTSMSIGVAEDVGNAEKGISKNRLAYLENIVYHHTGIDCPTCDDLLIIAREWCIDDDLDEFYWEGYYCQACAQYFNYDLMPTQVPSDQS